MFDLFKEYYTVEEAAKHFNVSKRTIYNWIDAGFIRTVQFGNKSSVRIPACELGRIKREALAIYKTSLTDEIAKTIIDRS